MSTSLDATLRDGASLGGGRPMTMQHDNQASRLANNAWVQLIFGTVVLVILIALAAKYVW